MQTPDSLGPRRVEEEIEEEVTVLVPVEEEVIDYEDVPFDEWEPEESDLAFKISQIIKYIATLLATGPTVTGMYPTWLSVINALMAFLAFMPPFLPVRKLLKGKITDLYNKVYAEHMHRTNSLSNKKYFFQITGAAFSLRF